MKNVKIIKLTRLEIAEQWFSQDRQFFYIICVYMNVQFA